MSATIHARDLVVSLGSNDILAGVSLSAAPGQRIGIVGPNGVGKSTLFKILAGLLEPERGSVDLAPPRSTVGYLPQEPDRRSDETVMGFLERRTGVLAAQQELDTSLAALTAGQPGADDTYADALERWLALGGADLDTRAEVLLEELGVGAAIATQPTATLSGGQAARVSLASVLLSRFDVLLLDEPTNDLDFAGLERLEAFATTTEATLLVISHDRAFLQAVVTDVLELDAHTRTGQLFRGGWDAYLEAKDIVRRHAEEDFAEYEAKRDELQTRAKRQHAWSNRGIAKAKHDKSEKDKFVRFHRIATSQKVASKARATERALERLETVDKPWKHWELSYEIAEAGRSGDIVARLEGAVVERGTFRLGPVDLLVRWQDRLAVVGPNGGGKTTLVETILGRLPLAAGERWLGPGVVVGELGQRRERFARDATLLDGFVDATDLTPQDARTLMAKFGLLADHVTRSAASLSPGERTRAALALFQASQVNTLVLDEPTNHLDLPAIEQLEQALDAFTGTIILISHDRRLLEGFAPTKLLEVDDGAISETTSDDLAL